jgi:hypothetical protein
LSPFAASSHTHGGTDEGNEAIFRQTSSLSTALGYDRRRKCCAKFAQLLRNKFNSIKHHSTRLNISRSCCWNHPAKSHPGQTQGSGEKWKLVKARVTPYFNKVFAARQNLADGCAESREMVMR